MASRYWVGGTGNWSDNTNHWSDTSGGSPGASKPTSADDVFFNGSSGSGTVTVDESASCADINFTAFAGTFAGTNALSIYGSVILDNTMTLTFSGTINLLGTGAETITSDGVQFSSHFEIGVAGCSYTLQDNFSTTSDIDLNAGTFDANDFNVTCTDFQAVDVSSDTAIYGGSGTWSITGSTGAFDITSTSIEYYCETSLIHFTTGNFDHQFRVPDTNQPAYDVQIDVGTLFVVFTTIVHDLTLAGGTNLKIQTTDRTLTVNGTLTINSSAGNEVDFYTSSEGVQCNLQLPAGIYNYDYVTIKDMELLGTDAVVCLGLNSTNVSNNAGDWRFDTVGIANFDDNSAQGFDNHTPVAIGADSTGYAGRQTNGASSANESTKGMDTGFTTGYETIKLYVKLPAAGVILSGDASALVIVDTDGWKWTSLYNWVDRDSTAWQEVKIPLSKLSSNGDGTPSSSPTGTLLDDATADSVKLRWWNSVSRNWDTDQMFLTTEVFDVTKTVTAKAKIVSTSTETVTVKSRVKYTGLTKTVNSKARVEITTVETVTAKADILGTVEKTVQAKSDIKIEVIKTVTAKAKLVTTGTKTIQALAKIFNSVTKTVQAKAEIIVGTYSKTVTAKGRMKVATPQTVTARASIDADILWYAQQPFRHPKARVTVDWNLGDGFQDETEYLFMAEVERKLTEPIGGVSIAQADVRFININDRYTPQGEVA